MPPKTKRQKQLEEDRAAKRRKTEGESSKPADEQENVAEQGEGSSSAGQEGEDPVPGEEDGDDDEQIDFDFVAAIAEYASE